MQNMVKERPKGVTGLTFDVDNYDVTQFDVLSSEKREAMLAKAKEAGIVLDPYVVIFCKSIGRDHETVRACVQHFYDKREFGAATAKRRFDPNVADWNDSQCYVVLEYRDTAVVDSMIKPYVKANFEQQNVVVSEWYTAEEVKQAVAKGFQDDDWVQAAEKNSGQFYTVNCWV
eukprot:TRINITY_DN77680_c0_g1_i1.p1 TRINITY_DN77680_c0_g1~~TRINITY_DN77680_c0_g1_i1.p1  ORF type:complete len:173 (+),score=30.86 TRINITY_DN77680_c0_g1_i1:51-569(+)